MRIKWEYIRKEKLWFGSIRGCGTNVYSEGRFWWWELFPSAHSDKIVEEGTTKSLKSAKRKASTALVACAKRKKRA